MFQISKVTKEDAGNYTCAPTNAQADSVMVHVIEGHLISFNHRHLIYIDC